MVEQFFWIGTEAEFIKVFPVILECQAEGCVCNIIATGQNDIKKSRIIKQISLSGEFVELSLEEDIKKNSVGLFSWFIKTKLLAKKIILQTFDIERLAGKNLIVHGDTVSTYMGALIGKSLGMRVCHVEAGLRSHNIFNPFPEEIDRLLTSRAARVHFAPGIEAIKNLSKVKGKVIDTKANTLEDSLMLSRNIPLIDDKVRNVVNGEEYFVFVMHRQENLANSKFVNEVVDEIIRISLKIRCVIILHTITKNKLTELARINELERLESVTLLPRIDYFDFMKLLDKSNFVITDGGSNQEELFYMRKPCLIMRKATERNEGLGINARLFDGTARDIESFFNEYQEIGIDNNFENKCVCRPSVIIKNELIRSE